MDNRLRSVPYWDGGELFRSHTLRPETQLRHLRNVTGSLIDEALKLWADLWREMEGRLVSGACVLPQAREGFKPACGWPEFLEKMWLLRYYLASAGRFSEQRREGED